MKSTNFIITICIVNYNTADFILNSLYCLEKLTKNKYKVIIRDNNSKLKDYLKLKKEINEFANVELYRVENFNLTGSIAHGIAINDLISKIDTEYGVILDADCTFLFMNWDRILFNEINEECPIIGTQASQSLGSTKPGDFPLMHGILFLTDILKSLQIDFRPENTETYKDTGYKLREVFLKNRFKGKIIHVRNTRFFKLGPFKKIICEEYYKEGINEIFACHFGRGASLGIDKYSKIVKSDGTRGHIKMLYLIPILRKYFLRFKGMRQKKRWIKICKKIVDTWKDLKT